VAVTTTDEERDAQLVNGLLASCSDERAGSSRTSIRTEHRRAT
jgi:hypothetical protein